MMDNPAERVERELAALKRLIRDNERIWAGFRAIEVSLIGATTPHEILHLLVTELPRLFTRVAAVSLAYIDTERELARLLERQREHFIEATQEELGARFPAPHRPHLGPCSPQDRELFFPGVDYAGSAAFVPLVVRGQLVGSLNQLSRLPDHFQSNDATDLLEHLAAVLAMCIENALGRERLKQDGLTDALTGVANRRFFERRLHEEVERCARHAEPLVCLLADIDHFKHINDRFGHGVGDGALRLVADALGNGLRTSDVLARYGGEEFVLLLPDTNLDQGYAIAERLRLAVANVDLERFPGLDHLTISIGLACLDGTEAQPDPEQLLRDADAALYQAKAAGRNRVWVTDAAE